MAKQYKKDRYMENKEPKNTSARAGKWFVIGLALGVAFGIIFDNLGLWLPIGVAIGLAGPALKRRMNKNNPNEPGNG